MTFESTTTDTDQGVGKVWFNHGTLSSASVMYMDDVDANSASINSYVDSWDDSTHTALRGTVTITQKASAAIFAIYNVTGVVTSASTYSKVAVTYVTGAGSFTDADASTVVFVRTGNTGGGMANVSEDGSPQLGADLDCNGNDITSASNADVDINPHGTGNVVLKTDLVSVGGGSEVGHVSSNGAYDLKLDTNSSSNSSSILITDAANGDIDFTCHGTGIINFNDRADYPQVAITSSSNATAWDAQAAPNAYHLTTENTTIGVPSNPATGAFISLNIKYGGSHTMAFNTVFEFAASTAPTFTSTLNKVDHLVFRYNGACWHEMGRNLNMAIT